MRRFEEGKIGRLSSALVAALWVWFAVGCGGANTDTSLPSRARNDNLSETGMELTTSDLNGDGRADQWELMRAGESVPTRVERDIDFNGRVDVYEYYDEQGNLVEEEMHLDFDDRIDVVRYYRDGTLVRRELATGFDGRFTMVKVYDASGNTLRVERDTTGDGRVDSWEYFEGGQVISVARDTDGDGQPEVSNIAP